MSKEKSIAAGHSGAASKAEHASTHSRGAVLRGRINIQMVQNVLLIWLDNNMDDNNDDCRNTVTQLRRAVHNINKFTDGDECVEFLQSMDNDKACMIISGSLGQHIVPRVHNMSQVDSIFIFCGNKKRHEQWAKEWPKIEGVFTDIAPICEALKQTAQQCEQNAISISFMATGGNNATKKLDQLDPSFMYTQILKEILLTIPFEQKHIMEFIEYCHDVLADNENQLKTVTKLERKYRDETPIWWYTYECFLYPMLNRALRLMDVDLIIKMGFFIGDLHRHIEQLHQEQFTGHHSGTSFTVYRGQGMSKVEFEKMTATKGGLLSFNCFLSTSKDRAVSLDFANRAATNPDLVGILFVMVIDPAQSTTPFASVVDVSCYKEDEVLFAMNTVFRIRDIKPMGGNHRLFQVELTLTSDNDKDLRLLTDHIREETDPDSSGWARLGLVLGKMGQPKKAQQVYEILLEQKTEESEKAPIYNQLGSVKYKQGEYQEAITFYEKALEIYKKTLPPNHPNLAMSYNNIGAVYESMGEYSKALSSHEKVLEIRQQSLPPNHPHLASSYGNIGNVYHIMGEYSKALSYHQKNLEIQQQSLPPNHPDLASSYGNIGSVYDSMGEYSKALSSHEKALEIQQQSLPPNHPDLAMSYNNIGGVYRNMGEYSKALSSHEKALEIRQQSLRPNHPDLAASYNNIGEVYRNMGEYSKALSHDEKALEIRQQSLPPNHPDLASPYNNIGLVYYEMADYSKALSSHEKALEIRQQSLPPNHPDLGMSYNNIGMVYYSMGEYSKALSSYEKDLEIIQKTLPLNHPDLAVSYNNIGMVYGKMGDYSKALSSYEKALEIQQQSLPPNHPALAWPYMNIGEVYNNIGEYSKALSSHQKSLEIRQQSLPPNHSDLAASYNKIGLVYVNMGNYSTARSFFERAVEIAQQSLPSNHPALQIYRKNLDRIKKKL
jgi:tetratricopeptide (TPR) repeat protein